MFVGLFFRSAFLSPAFSVQYIVAGYFMVAFAHQREFNLVLNVFNMKNSAIRTAAGQCIFNMPGEMFDDIVNSLGSGGFAFFIE